VAPSILGVANHPIHPLLDCPQLDTTACQVVYSVET
jgi:hypothetical protein